MATGRLQLNCVAPQGQKDSMMKLAWIVAASVVVLLAAELDRPWVFGLAVGLIVSMSMDLGARFSNPNRKGATNVS
jgi:hypothetical protein